MNDNNKSTQLFAMIEDYKVELDKQLAMALEEQSRLEEDIKRIRGEIASLPVKPRNQPKKKNGRKAKRTKAPADDRTVFEVARGIPRADPNPTYGECIAEERGDDE